MSENQRVALVSGANRGIGREIAKQLANKGMIVIVTARNEEKGKMTAAELTGQGTQVLAQQLDVTAQASVDRLAEAVNSELGRLLVLVNNAGIYIDGTQQGINADQNNSRIFAIRAFSQLKTGTGPWFYNQQEIKDLCRGTTYSRHKASLFRRMTFSKQGQPSIELTCGKREILHKRLTLFCRKTSVAPGSITRGNCENARIAKMRELLLDLEIVKQTLETNLFGAWRLCKAFIPLMQQHSYGRIVNVSSDMGQLEAMSGGYPAYRVSKTALNALTRILAAELGGTNILFNSVCPGWVKTDMGGAGAIRSVEKGAETPGWLATLPDGGPTGGFFQD